MGWILDTGEAWSYDHEGFVVAVVRDGFGWRELGTGDTAQPVQHVQVGCECGWRSQRYHAPLGTAWAPCIVHYDGVPGDDGTLFEDAASAVWEQHVASCTADSPLNLTRVVAVERRKALDQRLKTACAPPPRAAVRVR